VKTLSRIAAAFVLSSLLISAPTSASDPLAFTEEECRQEFAVKLWELKQWRKPVLKKGTSTNGLTTEHSGFVGFLLRKTQVIGWCLKPLRLQYRPSL